MAYTPKSIPNLSIPLVNATTINGKPNYVINDIWYRFFLNTASAVGGAAGGDLSGSYPDPVVASINGNPLGPTTVTSGNILIASGSSWNSKTVSGDATLSNTGVVTFPNVNTNVGTFQGITVNAKGQVTGATNQSYITSNQTITLSGDLTGSGTTSIAGTLKTVNSNVGTFGNIGIPQVTVNGKGLVTAASENTFINDANGNTILNFSTAANSVNYLQIQNAGTGGWPYILSAGTDASIPINFQSKGGEFVIQDYTGVNSAVILLTGPSFSSFTAIQNNSAATQNCVYVLPPADGTYNGAYLQTNGAQNLKWSTKGQIVGEPSTSNATTGNIGEYIVSAIAVGSAVSLSSTIAKTITSIVLPAGDWNIEANLVTAPAATTTQTSCTVGIGTVTNTLPTLGLDTTTSAQIFSTIPANDPISISTPIGRISTTGGTYFLVGKVTFATSTLTGYGFISARRAR